MTDLQTTDELPASFTNTTVDIAQKKPAAAGGGGYAGAFYTLLEDADGNTMIQGGSVSGGTGNVWVADFEVYDLATDTWAGTAGQLLVLTVSGAGVVADGVLLPGFNVSTATIAVSGTIGSNTLPTAASTAGTLKLALGYFTDGGFVPSRAGNFNITHCPGAFTIMRT